MAEKKVKVKLPLMKADQEDVYVAVNGEPYQIKRGVYVDVPAYIAEALDNSEKALAEAFEFEANAKK